MASGRGNGSMTILSQAQAIIDGQRKEEYGDVNESFSRIAGLWSAYLDHTITPFDVADMMILLKLSRLKVSPLHKDSSIDIVGYMLCKEKLEHGIPKKMVSINKNQNI